MEKNKKTACVFLLAIVLLSFFLLACDDGGGPNYSVDSGSNQRNCEIACSDLYSTAKDNCSYLAEVDKPACYDAAEAAYNQCLDGCG